MSQESQDGPRSISALSLSIGRQNPTLNKRNTSVFNYSQEVIKVMKKRVTHTLYQKLANSNAHQDQGLAGGISEWSAVEGWGGWMREGLMCWEGGIIAKWRWRYASPSTPKTGFFMCSPPTFKYWQRTHKFLNTSEAAALYNNFGLRQFPNLKKATSPHQVKKFWPNHCKEING